jgi:hypothetical protein
MLILHKSRSERKECLTVHDAYAYTLFVYIMMHDVNTTICLVFHTG